MNPYIIRVNGMTRLVKRDLYILDVFAEERYTGNQLAVIRNAEGFSDKEMQQIAKEMGYSETTFILSDKMEQGGYKVRIFTPATEVPFAGHPVLGTAYVIQTEIIKHPIDNITLNLKARQVTVIPYYEKDEIKKMEMKQIEPLFGKLFDSYELANIFSIDKSEIDIDFPIQEVSTGLPFIIVPLKTRDSLRRIKIQVEGYYRLIKNIDAKAVLAFAKGSHKRDRDLSARVFCDYYGIPEDPATGSANGCLAGYLVRYRYFGTTRIDIQVEQGYEMGRPSLLFLRAQETKGIQASTLPLGSNSNIEIYVGGKVIMVVKGYLL